MRNRPTPIQFGLFVCLPAAVMLVVLSAYPAIHVMSDFHKEFWPAGQNILHGRSPYLLGHGEVAAGLGFPYPAPAGLLFVPFALLPRSVADAVFTALCLLALVAALRVLRIRDWRLYGLVLLWAPVLNAWQSANVTLLLALGLALLWRHRDRPLAGGVIAALIVSLKPFVWPVGLWLLATRRYRAGAAALAAGALVNLAAFGVLGFGQIGRYLHDSDVVAGFFYRASYTPTALLLRLGLGPRPAEIFGILAALAAAGGCLRLGGRGDDLGALTLAVALMLLASPVLWMHYFTLALIPLAIARPRLEMVWAAPVLLLGFASRSDSAWQIAVVLALMAWVLHAARRPRAAAARAVSAPAGHALVQVPA